MASRRTQPRIMELNELEKAATHDERALESLNRYHEFLKQGKRPEIWWSRHNGWSVRDPLEFLSRKP